MNKTIFVIDDSSTIIMSMRNNLEIAGYTVESASNGQEALDLLKTGVKIDLIITDINMPKMDGLEFIRSARTLPKYRFTPILCLTTETQQSRREEAKKLGATGWMVKPIGAKDLLNVLTKLLP
jgi:two-component system chemotaxis response regulator CheY